MKQTVLVFVTVTLIASTPASLGANNAETKPMFRVVFFTPSDVEPPAGVRERLKEYVDYSQMFFAKWMNHWEYECEDPLSVNHDGEGYPEILYVKGQHTEASGRYKQLGFQKEVVATACREYKLDPEGQVWWIFTYKGPERRGFRGSGNAQRGGTSTSIYDPADEGHLRLEDDLGSVPVRNAKGSIHELGHALGLPHIGPHENDRFGNSLMGPIVRAYQNKYPKETRVYLTESSAAMLWKNPLFSGTTKDRDFTPTLELDDFEVTHDKERDRLIVAGKVVSDYGAHSIVVANESDATRSDYWMKCFATRVAEDGTFQVLIDELDHTDGQLRIVCCFNNGAIIGKAKGRGLQTGFVKQYRFEDESFTFIDAWGPQQSGLFNRAARRRRQPPPNGPTRPPVADESTEQPRS
ncbi:MAG: hypothetical protein ACR2NU_13735 [Aeoliella sp.]